MPNAISLDPNLPEEITVPVTMENQFRLLHDRWRLATVHHDQAFRRRVKISDRKDKSLLVHGRDRVFAGRQSSAVDDEVKRHVRSQLDRLGAGSRSH